MTINTAYGDITASEETLCSLYNDLVEAVRVYQNEGFRAIANRTKEVANTIYTALDKKGYFDNVKTSPTSL